MYPPDDLCTNEGCVNVKVLKKAKARRVVVYTFDCGAQPAWAVNLYCPGEHQLTLYTEK